MCAGVQERGNEVLQQQRSAQHCIFLASGGRQPTRMIHTVLVEACAAYMRGHFRGEGLAVFGQIHLVDTGNNRGRVVHVEGFR